MNFQPTSALRCCGLLAGLALAAPAMAAPTVAISGPATVTAGGVLQLSIDASGFSNLYAYQFDIGFDKNAYTLTTVSEGALLSSGGTTFFDGGTVDNVGGSVSFVFNTLLGAGPGVDGSGSLASLSFNVGSAFVGSSRFTISNFSALDAQFNSIDTTLLGANVAVVPEPSALLLAWGGLALLAMKQRRPRQQTCERAATA